MNENIEDNVPEVLEKQEPQHSDIEVRAMELGWKPKEEFSGNEDDFIDAKEFVRRQPLFDKIENQNRHLKSVTKALEALKMHYTRVEEAAVNKALNSLKHQRKQALTDGDGDSFELLDDEIKKAEQQLVSIEQVKNQPIVEEQVVHPEWQAFQSRNPWYTSTPYMRTFADKVGTELAAQGVAPSDVLKQVEQAVRKEFPNKFVNPNKESAPDISNSKGNPSAKRGGDEGKLSDNQRKIMNDLIRQKVLTKEEYIADLRAIGELK